MINYRLATISFVFLSLLGCAGTTGVSPPIATGKAVDAAPMTLDLTVSVDAGGLKELCFQSGEGDRVLYRFEASQSLNFNLHYHVAEEVYYPVPEHATAAEKGEYFIPADDTYCLMWTNTHAEAVSMSVQLDGAADTVWY